MNETIRTLESEVRGYCRSFPAEFSHARGAWLFDRDGEAYLDFFAGAGALSYGHNNPHLKDALVRYLASDGVTHSLDMTTSAKCHFLETFRRRVLAPRGMEYKTIFPGPTGTNAVEVALKLARKVTGRTPVAAFTNAFHGMTLGSLALTGNRGKRKAAGVPLTHVQRQPFDGYLGEQDTLEFIEKKLTDGSSGMAAPAAFIVETVQAEGGINVASRAWIEGLARLAKKLGSLLIIDDIQVGCGRTGPFFSFEGWDLEPDMICLSKSLSGFGLPFAITLLKPEHDVFAPGEHNGTFRGFNLAFVTAATALEAYWQDDSLTRAVEAKGTMVREALGALAQELGGTVRGRGLIQGLELPDSTLAGKISRACFERNLIVETAGAADQVLKILPPLLIGEQDLRRGLEVIAEATRAVCSAVETPDLVEV